MRNKKIIIIEELLPGKVNAQFREALCFERAFKRKDIPVKVIDTIRDQISEDELTSYGSMLIIQNYDLQKISSDVIHSFTGTKLFWSIDSHKAVDTHIAFCKACSIDHVLVSSKGYVEKFRQNGLAAQWFPNCYPSDLIYPSDAPKERLIGFCGSFGNRKAWTDFLVNKIPDMKLSINVLGADMVKAINECYIHWNRNEADDINARTFETMGAGSLLFTNKTPGLLDIFEDGKHLVIYDTMEDCFEKIVAWAKSGKIAEVAAEGHREVSMKHTYDARTDSILSILKGNK